MGILPRIRYLLEMDPVEALEECLVTILIGLSRHSRACADAVMKCPRLVQTIANRFAKKVTVEAHPSMIKSVILLKTEREANGLTEMLLNKGLKSCYMGNVLLQEYEQYAVQLVGDKKEEMGHHTNEVGRHMSCTPSGQNQRIWHSCQQESLIYQTHQHVLKLSFKRIFNGANSYKICQAEDQPHKDRPIQQKDH